MDPQKRAATERKYRLPYHWMRDPHEREALPYFGYVSLALSLLPRASRVLDAGCGDGRVTAALVEAGHAASGVELVEHQLHYARCLVPEASFHHADLRRPLDEQTPLEPEGFDACLCLEVYEHVPPDEAGRVLDTLRRALASGGLLVLSAPSKRLPVSSLHYRHFDLPELKAEVESHGFRVETVIRQHRLTPAARWLMGPVVEGLIRNAYVRLPVLERLRARVYRKWFNHVAGDRPAGRYLLAARKS